MFSVYGENLIEDDLLFLKSGTSNVRIEVHNSTDDYNIIFDNDTIETNRSNVSYNFKIDDNDDITTNIVKRTEKDLSIDSYQFFNFEQINENPIDISISISQPVFSNPTLNIGDVYYICTLDTVYNVPLLSVDDNSFVDQSGNELVNIAGVGFIISMQSKTILEYFKTFENADIKILPESLKIFAKIGNIWTEIHRQTRLELGNVYTINYVGVETDTFLFVIDSIYFHRSESIDNYNSLNALQQNSLFKVQFGYIELYGASKCNTGYHISLTNKSLVDINSISTNKLILNNKLYTDFLSKNDIADLNFRLSDYTNQTTFESLLTPGLQDSAILMQSNIIPVVNKTLLDDGSFLFEYDKSINANHIQQLYNLGNNSTDGILKQAINGDIYKSNTIDIINTSNLHVNNSIVLNDNELKWNNNTYSFSHSHNNKIQNYVLDTMSIHPNIKNNNIIIESNILDRFIQNETDYGQNNWNNDRISITFSNLDLDFQYTLSQSSPSQYENVPLFDNLKNYIIHNTNLLTSRLGSSFNPERNAYNPFSDLYDKFGNPNQSSDFIYKLVDNGVDYYYGDFFQLDMNEYVVLHKVSWINIQNEVIDNYDEADIVNNSYRLLNTLKSFIVLGYNEDHNKWDLLLNIENYNHSISNSEHIFDVMNKNNSYKSIRVAITSIHVTTTIRKEYSDADGTNLDPTYTLYYNEEVEKAHDIVNNPHIYTTYHNERPVAIKNLNFHIQFKEDTTNNIISTPINSIISTEKIHIKDNDHNTNYKTRLIINDEYINGSSNTNAIFHINDLEHVNNEEINFIKLCLKKPNYFNVFNSELEKNTENCVIHSINIDEVDRTFYNIHVANYPNPDRLLEPSVLSITDSGKNKDERQPSVGINVNQNLLHSSGLFVSPKITLYNNDCSNCIHIQMKDETSNYTIILPDILESKPVSQNSFLRVVNNDNNVLTTEWGVPEETLFTTYDIYIGKQENSNIFDVSNGYTYSNNDTVENMVHIRKMFVGMSETLHVEGEEKHLVDDINKYVAYFGGKIYASSDVTTDSDISYKHSLEILNKPRYKIEQLTGYTFDRNDTEENRRFCGLIAQDVEKVLPEAILKKHDGKLRVMYNNLSALFVECLKEIYSELDQLKKEVHNCKVTP